VDPDTGAVQVFQNPAKTEWSAKGMVVGLDGNLYFGTAPGAHLLRLETATGKLTDLGQPSRTETYIWQTALGVDGKIYGCTYPSAKLVRYDPVSNVSEDLGRMDPIQMYGRTITATADGFVYVGIGSATAHLAAYQISTSVHQDILPPAYQVSGFAYTHLGTDGNAYALIGNQNFRLKGWNAIPVTPAAVASAPAPNVFADGRRIGIANGFINVTDPHTGKWTTAFPYDYVGEPLAVWRASLGPDGMLYASTVLPANLIQADPRTGTLARVGQMGGGEAYSLLANNGRLLIAAYYGNAPLMSFDPTKPFTTSTPPNPSLTTYTGQDNGWRPQSMIAGPDGLIYIGAVAGYGQLMGPLTVWDTADGSVNQYPIYEDQSVVSVATANGFIVGGTSVSGGGGSHPTATEAKLFMWDTVKARKIFDTVPVAKAATITNLVTAPSGTVYGTAGTTLFAFDTQTQRVSLSLDLGLSALPSSLMAGPDGNLWGLTADGIFQFDLGNHTTKLTRTPQQVTAGMAMDAENIYFASGSTLFSYRWAPLAPHRNIPRRDIPRR
jgi:streptogramin lyase